MNINEYPVLEDLIIMHRTKAAIIIPETFQAPHLHLTLIVPIRSRLLPTAVVLVTLCLVTRHGPLIHILLSKYTSPVAFIHAPARGARDRLVPCFQS